MCAGFVGGFEAGSDEHGADAEAGVGGEYGEEVEDWWRGKGWMLCHRGRRGGCRVEYETTFLVGSIES